MLVSLLAQLDEDGFMKASQILCTWLGRGDCNRRSANTFYSLVQSVNSHVRRLMSEKSAHDEELLQMKMKFRQRMEGILRQCMYLDVVCGGIPLDDILFRLQALKCCMVIFG